jgi:hypothetical protein
LNTVTEAVPGAVTSVAGIAAVREVEVPKVVGRSEPFHRTVEPETKPLPVTVRVNAGEPATALVGLIELVAGEGLLGASTVNGALEPELSGLPLVLVAVITTPDAATGYVTPETVTWFEPLAIDPVVVPPSVPGVLESVKAVAWDTLLGLPAASCDCTVTVKGEPATGFAPPLTDVTASLAAAPVVTLNAELVALVRAGLLVAVSV